MTDPHVGRLFLVQALLNWRLTDNREVIELAQAIADVELELASATTVILNVLANPFPGEDQPMVSPSDPRCFISAVARGTDAGDVAQRFADAVTIGLGADLADSNTLIVTEVAPRSSSTTFHFVVNAFHP